MYVYNLQTFNIVHCDVMKGESRGREVEHKSFKKQQTIK